MPTLTALEGALALDAARVRVRHGRAAHAFRAARGRVVVGAAGVATAVRAGPAEELAAPADAARITEARRGTCRARAIAEQSAAPAVRDHTFTAVAAVRAPPAGAWSAAAAARAVAGLALGRHAAIGSATVLHGVGIAARGAHAGAQQRAPLTMRTAHAPIAGRLAALGRGAGFTTTAAGQDVVVGRAAIATCMVAALADTRAAHQIADLVRAADLIATTGLVRDALAHVELATRVAAQSPTAQIERGAAMTGQIRPVARLTELCDTIAARRGLGVIDVTLLGARLGVVTRADETRSDDGKHREWGGAHLETLLYRGAGRTNQRVTTRLRESRRITRILSPSQHY